MTPDPVTEPDLQKSSRKAWGSIEVLHVLAYFAPPVTAAYVALGLRPRFSYFAARSAAYGPVGPAVPCATFYTFAPWLFSKTLPSCWEIASPEQVLAARDESMTEVMAQVVADTDLTELLGLLRTVCDGLTAPGRPLYAAHAALPWPDDPRLALWHATALIREHRGDGHIALLVSESLDPVEAIVLNGIFAGTTEFMRTTRGWSQEEWDAGTARLEERGLVADGSLTDEGTTFRRGLERGTDRLALEGWRHLGLAGTRRVTELATPLRDSALASGLLPDWMTRAR